MKILFLRNQFTVNDSSMQSKRINESMGLYPPIALCHIAAVAREKGHDIKLIDAAAEQIGHEDLMTLIGDYGPDLVCFSLWTVMFKADTKLAAPIKEIAPNAKVAIGGPHCDLYSHETLTAYPAIDYAAIGEGEETFAELLDAMEGKREMGSVNGLVWRDGDTLVENTPRDKVKDLDSIPFPTIDLLPLEKYYSIMAKQDRPIYILTTRGCPYKCAYCVDQQFGRSVRYHSPDYVIRYWKWLVEELGVNEVHLYDDTFTLNKNRTLKICQGLIDEGLSHTSWTVRTRVDTVDEEILQALWDSGCYRIGYGVESGNQRILDIMQRDQTLESVRQAFKWTRKHPFEIVANFMIGYIGEDRSTYNDTLKFALEIDPDFAYFSITHAEPNSTLYYQALEQDLIKPDVWKDFILGKIDQIDPKNNVFTTSDYSLEDLKKMQSWAYLRFYLRPSKVWKQVAKVKSPEMFFRKAKMATAMVMSHVDAVVSKWSSGSTEGHPAAR